MGIEHCQGEYIVFIDGDDYIDNDYLEHFVRMLPADLILQSVTDFCYDYDKAKTQYHFQDKNYGGDFYELFSKYNLYKFGAPWARIFKTSIIKENRLRFDPDLQYREDELFFLSYLKFCKEVKTSSYSGYHYIYYPTSAKSKNHRFEHNYKVATKIYVAQSELGKEKSYDVAFFNTIVFQCISSLFVSLSSLYKERNSKEYRLMCIKIIKHFFREDLLQSGYRVCLTGKYKILNLPDFIIDAIFRCKTKILQRVCKS